MRLFSALTLLLAMFCYPRRMYVHTMHKKVKSGRQTQEGKERTNNMTGKKNMKVRGREKTRRLACRHPGKKLFYISTIQFLPQVARRRGRRRDGRVLGSPSAPAG